jgi:uncharacterized protein (TIGR03067 family)
MRISLALMAAITVVAIGCRKKPDAALVDADRERLQGVWAPELVDTGDSDNAPSRAEVEETRFQFQGDSLSITSKGKVVDRFSFTLDATSEPKRMTVTDRSIDGRQSKDPAKREGLYKFEDDRLVLVMNREPGPRPVEFKAQPFERAFDKPRDAGAMLVRLRKIDEPPVNPENNSGLTRK